MTSLPRKTIAPNGLTFLKITVFHYNIQYEKSKDATWSQSLLHYFFRYSILSAAYCLLR